ncbi:MAG: response regulator [Candidatus Omnitrophota bacterium]
MGIRKALTGAVKSNLRAKITLFFAAIVLFFAILNGVGTSSVLSSRLTRELLRDNVLFAESLSKHLIEPFLARDTGKMTDNLFDQRYAHSSLAYLFILDEKNQCLASTSLGSALEEELRLLNPLSPGQTEHILLVTTSLGPVYDIAVPLAYGRGVLRIGLLRKNIDDVIQGVLGMLLLTTILSFFFAMVFVHFLAGALTKPLDYFKRSVQRIGQGDLDTRVDIHTRDEIGDLARAFNQMAVDLKKSKEDLEKTMVSHDSLLQEIAVRKKVEENLDRVSQRNKLVLNSAAEGILGLDLEGRHTFVNPAAASMLGYKMDELLGQPSHSLWHHTQPDGNPAPPEACAIHATFRDGATRHVSAEVFWRKDGTSFPVEYTAAPIYDEGQLSGAVVFFSDGTERRRFAEAENSRIAAELASKAKSDFLAAMSHEIRTPLSAVIGYADILSKTPLNEEQKKYVTTMDSSGKLLLTLINDILDFSKIEAGKIVLEDVFFDLEYLIKDVFKIASTKIPRGKITTYVDFHKEAPTRVKGDPTRMRQILLNLLNNAIKFTRQGEIGLTVELSTETASPEEPVVLMTVKDTGIGIPADKRTLLFQQFSQVDVSTTRKYGGAGLGLSICKALIEKMGGRIWVESEENVGSAFKFTVKLKKGAALIDSSVSLLTKEELASKKILIVDDNRVSQEIVERYCRDLGLSVTFIASSAKEAIDHLQGLAGTGSFPDILLSDIRMADMDGYQLVEKLTALFPDCGMKFIAITSDLWPGASPKSEMKGFHGFIVKPVLREDLAGVIGIILGDRRPEKKIVTKHTFHELVCKNMRVLVAEDAKTNRDLVEIFLTGWGCQVDFAENGEEAVEKVRMNKYDVCLMDLQMPKMGGLEATQIIRREISKDLPIIALTAAATDDMKAACMSSGMTDYVLKPINVAELKEKLIQHGRPSA